MTNSRDTRTEHWRLDSNIALYEQNDDTQFVLNHILDISNEKIM